MGFPVIRAVAEVDAELICPICQDVLQDPKLCPCEHSFCNSCICTWLRRDRSCPVDRKRVTLRRLKPPTRMLTNFLSRLVFTCENAEIGCSESINYDSLIEHQQHCLENLNRMVPCVHGCGTNILKKDQNTHNCVETLREKCEHQVKQIVTLEKTVAKESCKVRSHLKEIDGLTEIVEGQATELHDQAQQIRKFKEELAKIRRMEASRQTLSKKRRRTNMQVSVKMICTTGKTLIVNMESDHLVGDLMTLIENTQKVPLTSQRISLATGPDLENDKTLSECGIVEGSTLLCRSQDSGGNKCFTMENLTRIQKIMSDWSSSHSTAAEDRHQLSTPEAKEA